MDSREIVNFCIEKGILIDGELFGLFKDADDISSIKMIIEKVREYSEEKIMTKSVFSENRDKVIQVFSELPKEKQKKLERLRINLGLSIEISMKEVQTADSAEKNHFNSESAMMVVESFPPTRKKLEVSDFSNHLRNRFLELKKILQENSRLENLVSISKISGMNQKFSIIGMVYDKKITKNKNILFEVEDLTGMTRVVVTQNSGNAYKNALDVCADSVMGFKGAGSKNILFANEVVFPDIALLEKKKSPVDESVVFISDIHVGSQNFMEKNFLRFVDYLNGKIPNTPEAGKIKYLFVVGDLIAGVGVYPGQEKALAIKDIESQYAKIAELLDKIRKDIKILIIPGNHDCVRLMEPQPILNEKYSWPLHNLKNVFLASNPSLINIGSTKTFSGLNILAYHGFSYPYYANNIPSLIEGKAVRSPDKIMAYLLKNRHIAPTHNSTQHSPSEEDHLLIKKIPDIFVSGHTHTNAASYYNNILVISNGCWELLMPYQEMMGFKSDYCKVPMFNLKTRELRILDFYDGEKRESNKAQDFASLPNL